ncbi:uncharacterized protein LOC133286149 [Gastrolobium bilobum]|uniref:uncharacterized protein LOC133286149 n=1 Tax=Gastrolobium bilobum TaxID=150636 RepID=UPI002AB15CE3|nr:uncharacterized protein LOC133286149 [Gastrolobium bilobum]
MVFAGSEEETMAMGPERSKPLHNFMLPCLKWGSQRHLRCMKVNPNGADASDAGDPRKKRELEPMVNNARDSEKRMRMTKPPIHGDDGIDAVREKLMLDLKTEADRIKDAILRKEVAAENDDHEEAAAEEEVRPEAVAAAAGVRPWNLRTRRAACKAPAAGDSGKGLKIEEKKPNNSSSPSPLRTNNGAVKSPKLRGTPEKTKTEKVKFSLSLSRKEIEEDFMQLLGHRPPRRPKKRPRVVQKQLDTLFPGMWLSEVTADSYKVEEAPENGKVALRLATLKAPVG